MEIIKRSDGYYHKGRKVTDQTLLAKIKSIYVPPAYVDVKIYPNSKKKVAIGYDDKGRLQSLYNREYTKKQAEKKYCRILKT